MRTAHHRARLVMATLALAGLIVSLTAAPVRAQAPAGDASKQTASQFYMAYRAAFDKAKSVEDLFPYMAEKNRKEAEATPAAERKKMFQMIKMMGALTNVKVIKEARSPDGGATLTVEGTQSDKDKATGTIEIVKEGGAWKIGSESWKS